jgi:hypothetical protein
LQFKIKKTHAKAQRRKGDAEKDKLLLDLLESTFFASLREIFLLPW